MIYFIIPVYNESENLERLVKETSSLMQEANKQFRIIFVNDGSTDNSLEVLESLKKNISEIIILSHSPNKGVRTTFLEGFQYFLENACAGDIAITKEADNTSDNAITLQMIQEISSDGYDIVLASCYMPGGGFDKTSLFRKSMSVIANTMIKARFKLWKIHTFSSFYRAFSYNTLEKAFKKHSTDIMTRDGFCCVVEMLIKLHKMNFKIIEIPMILKSQERKGKSKMPIMKTIIGYFKLCLQQF